MTEEQDMTRFLHERLPVCAAMGVEVVALSPLRVTLRGQLGPNINPYGVVFGGSIATFGLVASWTLVHRALGAAKVAAYPVVSRSGCEFLRPVTEAFTAEVEADAKAMQAFVESARQGRARISLRSEITCAGRLAAVHTADFAAVRST
jgi:thioesterase domain-containing protein